MAYHDGNADFSRRGLPKNGQGVRGGVAYRKLSDSYANDKNYPHWFFVGINVLLILLALSLLAFLLYLFTPLGDFLELDGERVEICYTLEFYDVTGALATAPLQGAAVTLPETEAVLGEVRAVSVRQAEIPVIEWQPEWETLPQDAPTTTLTHPARLVTVTVAATATRGKDGSYRIGETVLAEGSSYRVSLGGTVAAAACTGLLWENKIW